MKRHDARDDGGGEAGAGSGDSGPGVGAARRESLPCDVTHVDVAVARRGAGPAMSVVVCSNRPRLIERHVPRLLPAFASDDEIIVVLDCRDLPAAPLLTRSGALELRVISNGATRGLSYSRNLGLAAASRSVVLFLDDDVTLSTAAVRAIRAAFEAGAQVVGAQLSAPPGTRLARWYIGSGQYHYLGIHAPHVERSPWGACMGFDIGVVRANRLGFAFDLGRKGGGFESGDDSSFVAELRSRGARVSFLDREDVYHHVQPERLRLRTMLRRAWWQGRSEVRRKSMVRGIRKELARQFAAAEPLLRRVLLASLYGGAVIHGAAYERARAWVDRK